MQFKAIANDHEITLDLGTDAGGLDKGPRHKAVDLSMEKYCGVSYTLGKALNLTSEIKILK